VEDSIFTKIIRREIPAAIVYEDDATIAFMDAGQVNPGHVLVATKQPAETLLDIDDALAASPTAHREAETAKAHRG